MYGALAVVGIAAVVAGVTLVSGQKTPTTSTSSINPKIAVSYNTSTYTITLTGSGFTSSGNVNWTTVYGTFTSTGIIKADSNGAINYVQTYIVPSTAMTQQWTATDVATNVSSNTQSITIPAVPQTQTSSSGNVAPAATSTATSLATPLTTTLNNTGSSMQTYNSLTLSVSPTAISKTDGASVVINGSGFPANSKGIISGQYIGLSGYVADGNGNFSIKVSYYFNAQQVSALANAIQDATGNFINISAYDYTLNKNSNSVQLYFA